MYYGVIWGGVRCGERGGTRFLDTHPVGTSFETKMAALWSSILTPTILTRNGGKGRVSSVKTKVSPASYPETALFMLNKNYVRHDSFFNVQKSFVSFKD